LTTFIQIQILKFLSLIFLAFFFSKTAITQPANNIAGISKSIFIPSEKIIFYKLGDRTIPITTFQYGDVKDIVCINLHDNENTSVQAARSLLELKGGTLIKIENNNQRVVRFKLRGVTYGFDPNRMFSRTGIEQTLRENRKISQLAEDEVEKFAQRLLVLIPDSTSCIIALHNNTNEAFSITSYLAGNDRQFDARAVYADSLQDIDDIALTTDSLLYSKMADNGYNAIWQDNEKAKKDGSLSIFCGERSRRYINIETQNGKLDQYVEMLEKLLNILAKENEKFPGMPENAQ